MQLYTPDISLSVESISVCVTVCSDKLSHTSKIKTFFNQSCHYGKRIIQGLTNFSSAVSKHVHMKVQIYTVHDCIQLRVCVSYGQ